MRMIFRNIIPRDWRENRRVTLWAGAVIFVAAFIGGAVNSVSGGGTLITFPALIWTGMNPVHRQCHQHGFLVAGLARESDRISPRVQHA